MTTTADLLEEYGQSIRGDWSDIDGRSEKDRLDELADAIRKFGNEELSAYSAWILRDQLCVCQHGKGHWEAHCLPEECPHTCRPEREPQP